MTATRAALIEEDGVETVWIEQRAMDMLAAAAGPPVQKERRNAFAPSNLFNIEPVPVPGVEHYRVEGPEGGPSLARHPGSRP